MTERYHLQDTLSRMQHLAAVNITDIEGQQYVGLVSSVYADRLTVFQVSGLTKVSIPFRRIRKLEYTLNGNQMVLELDGQGHQALASSMVD